MLVSLHQAQELGAVSLFIRKHSSLLRLYPHSPTEAPQVFCTSFVLLPSDQQDMLQEGAHTHLLLEPTLSVLLEACLLTPFRFFPDFASEDSSVSETCLVFHPVQLW